MPKHGWLSIALFLLPLALISAGCTPRASPASVTPSPIATPVAQPAPAPVSGEDVAWAKVVSEAKKEGMLVFQASTTFAGDTGLTISRAFKEKYGIRLEIIASRGGENYERLKTEKRSGQRAASLTQASGIYLKLMKSEGMLAPVKDLPSFREQDAWSIHPLRVDPDGQIINYMKTWMSPYVNTKQIRPGEEPQSLQDFLKPQWKGKMILSDPRTGSGSYWYYTTLVRRGIIDWSYVKSLGQQELLLERNASAAMDSVMRGVVPITLIGFATTSGVLVDAGAPIKAISLKEGDVFDLSGMAMVEGAPHPNATKVFINWLLSQEGLTHFSNVAKQDTLRKDVPNLMPKDVIPPSTTNQKIGVGLEDLEEAEKLFREGFMPNLLGLKR